MQTNQKAFAAFAVLSVDPDLDEDVTGMSREQLRELALAMLRFSLESHIEGSYECCDGTSWGHTWISGLGIERMMHGVEALWPYLTLRDRTLLQTVLISESEWLLDNYPVAAGLVNNNKPESNLWNGALLHRAATMYPEAPRAAQYREKGSAFLINAISLPADAASQEYCDGKPISEWHIGTNFFDSYALNHHQYLNIGYMVICLSNTAISHFTYKKNNCTSPDALYHHVHDLWHLIKTCTFPDGRLLRIGGDTRARYCYCQDYCIPALLMIRDKYNDSDCEQFENGWLELVATEKRINGDGSFLSHRAEKIEAASPLYYTRLESDRAVTLSMGLYWRRIFDLSNKPTQHAGEPVKVFDLWRDAYHGACLHRSANRIASWVWKAAEGPQGLCVPPHRSDLAEWRHNLSGDIRGMGRFNTTSVESSTQHIFKGGFMTYARMHVYTETFVAEGEQKRVVADQKIFFAALPDDATVLLMHHACAVHHDYIAGIKGLSLHIPNDVYNGNIRTYHSREKMQQLCGYGSPMETVCIDGSWLTIDDCLSIITAYSNGPLVIFRPGTRQVDLKHNFDRDYAADTGSLYADEICCPFSNRRKRVSPGNILIDAGFLIRCGMSAPETDAYNTSGRFFPIVLPDRPEIRTLLCTGADEKKYLFLAHTGMDVVGDISAIPCTVPTAKNLVDIVSGEVLDAKKTSGSFTLTLKPETARLFSVE